jgi:hypothetical protein
LLFFTFKRRTSVHPFVGTFDSRSEDMIQSALTLD